MNDPWEDVRDRLYGRSYAWSKQQRAEDVMRLIEDADALLGLRDTIQYEIVMLEREGVSIDGFIDPHSFPAEDYPDEARLSRFRSALAALPEHLKEK